jgi:hypothetical protein
MSGLLSQGLLSNKKLSGFVGIPNNIENYYENYYNYGTEQEAWVNGYFVSGDQLNKLSDSLQIIISTGNSAFVTDNVVSLVGFKKLWFEAEATIDSASQLSLGIANNKMDTSSVATLAYVSNLGRGGYYLDVTSYQDSYYIKIRGDGSSVSAKIYRVWGER